MKFSDVNVGDKFKTIPNGFVYLKIALHEWDESGFVAVNVVSLGNYGLYYIEDDLEVVPCYT